MHPCVMIMSDVRRHGLPNSALCRGATGRKLACCIDLHWQLALELGASSAARAGLRTLSSRFEPAHPRAPQATSERARPQATSRPGATNFFGEHIYRLRTPLMANDPDRGHEAGSRGPGAPRLVRACLGRLGTTRRCQCAQRSASSESPQGSLPSWAPSSQVPPGSCICHWPRFALRHKLNVRMSLRADGLKTSVLRTGQLPTGRKRVLLSFA
jgi:hypothetical protein